MLGRALWVNAGKDFRAAGAAGELSGVADASESPGELRAWIGLACGAEKSGDVDAASMEIFAAWSLSSSIAVCCSASRSPRYCCKSASSVFCC
jgi:hypothetical protein